MFLHVPRRQWFHALGLLATICLVVAAVAVAAEAEQDRKDPEGQQEKPAGPEIRLTVSPRHGFSPLSISLTATLSSVKSGDPEYCHPGAEWEARTPSGLTAVSKEDPRCLHPPERIEVPLTFTKLVTLHQPGLYTYRFILHRRDGSRLMSNTQEIRVLDAY